MARGQDGVRHSYADPQLQREIGEIDAGRPQPRRLTVVIVVAARKPRTSGSGPLIPLPPRWTRSSSAAADGQADRGRTRKRLQWNDSRIDGVDGDGRAIDESAGAAPAVNRDKTLVGELPKTRTAQGGGSPSHWPRMPRFRTQTAPRRSSGYSKR